MKQYINILFSLLLALTLFTSCENLLEVTPEEVLLTDDYLGDDELDARSALFGVLGQMQDITAQYVVLGEMRADLADVSPEATDELRQINNHQISSENSYTDLTNIFSIINNCNFAIAGIDTEAFEGVLLEDYASILRIRTWAQLQILINYGQLPYIDTPITSDDDFDKNYPLLSFEDGITQLIENLELIAGIENVSKYENSLGYSIFKMIPDNDILLGDLYLWKGDHVLAATHYKQFLDDNVLGNTYNLNNFDTSTILSAGVYTVNGEAWGLGIFNDFPQSTVIINYTAFVEAYRQPNTGYAVLKEQITYSPVIAQKWSAQIRGFEGAPYEQANYPGDFVRFEGSIDPTDFSISKYNYNYFSWYRAAKVYLRYAEAINYAGYPEQALAIINGIFNNTQVAPIDAPVFNNTEAYLNFDIDQYYATNSSGQPISGNQGIRGRVDLAPVNVDPGLTDAQTIEAVGALILNEAALELAFEGNRWEDLLRFAKRANTPAIVADAVFSKFESLGDLSTANTIQQKLLNPDNWYLPLTIPDNFVAD
ncbi:RagB/SusD family nutrient uptake outer membrane protein [Flavivirga jejuensis]|uniref:RagB/SusD family nutrient uptake outer membrane protein n=1 Tax=Flavivirga jejuensis TaxID=870487 RepID=A0ABT8WKN4_9FLAO|nr:RagB/SusD family nutrient uptake outer membrane protein [Flavivirga jejuensis]MDO5973673.1 RagB/SusD family nutrient uptake outer membrane protein [Flavivirga jejuensis]